MAEHLEDLEVITTYHWYNYDSKSTEDKRVLERVINRPRLSVFATYNQEARQFIFARRRNIQLNKKLDSLWQRGSADLIKYQ